MDLRSSDQMDYRGPFSTVRAVTKWLQQYAPEEEMISIGNILDISIRILDINRGDIHHYYASAAWGIPLARRVLRVKVP